MAETVECSECGASYDSESHPFCPRCGSTARGTPLPGAVASAARRSPGRRRVQASGFVLVAVGVLFLVSAAASLLVPAQEAAEPLVDAIATQPGGKVVLAFPAAGGGNGTPGTARFLGLDDAELGNATADAGGQVAFDSPQASLRVEARQGAWAWNRTVVAMRGDTVTIRLPSGGDERGADGGLVLGKTLVAAASVARYVLLVSAVLLVAGGAAALTLRWFALAATGALTGALFGLLALVGFLAAGLLFALPFGLCAYFILSGRRHFRHREPQSPATTMPPPPPSPPQP